MICDVAACRSQLLKNNHAITTGFSQHSTLILKLQLCQTYSREKFEGKLETFFSSLLMHLAQASLLSAILLADTDCFPL